MADPIQLTNFPDLSVEDTVSLAISPGSDPSGVELVLESDPSVTWWKAIELHAPDDRIIRQVETQDANHGPNTVIASAADLRGARLVLAKAKVFGIHTGMYELRDLDRQAGNRLDFLWQRDDDRDGPVAGFFRDLGRGVDTAANAVADAVETVINAVGDAISDVIEELGNFVAGVLDAVGSFLEQIPLVGPLLRGLFHWLGTFISAAFDLIATAIKAILNVVAAIVGGLVRIIGGALGGLLAWDAGIAGRSVLRGLADIGASVAGAVILILAKVLAYVQAFLFMQFGERPLTKDEQALLARVYRGSVAYTNIRLIRGFAGFYSINDRPFTLGEKIYLKNVDPAGQPDVLVHECCHVWQYQHFGSRYVMEALAAQASADGYDWQAGLDHGAITWRDLNREQQAQFIQDAWRDGRMALPPLTGSGVFFKDDPIGTDVEFDVGGSSHTSLAIDAITYIRSLVSFRISQFL